MAPVCNGSTNTAGSRGGRRAFNPLSFALLARVEVATIAANGDEAIGQMITDAFEKASPAFCSVLSA